MHICPWCETEGVSSYSFYNCNSKNPARCKSCGELSFHKNITATLIENIAILISPVIFYLLFFGGNFVINILLALFFTLPWAFKYLSLKNNALLRCNENICSKQSNNYIHYLFIIIFSVALLMFISSFFINKLSNEEINQLSKEKTGKEIHEFFPK